MQNLFFHNVEKISGPKRSIKMFDHFTCTSANVICCITCTYWNKLYIGETGRRLSDRFREHLRDVERNDKDASKPVARHFNLPNHSKQHMAVCGLSLHLGSSESRKTLEQKFIFQIGTLNPHGINERFYGRHLSLNYTEPLWTHLNQERENVYPFRAQGRIGSTAVLNSNATRGAPLHFRYHRNNIIDIPFPEKGFNR